MGAGVWGTKFIDYSYNADRIKVSTALLEDKNMIVGAIYQKHCEGDGKVSSAGWKNSSWPSGGCGSGEYSSCFGDESSCGFENFVSDEDRDIYFLYFVYKAKTWNAGVLNGWNHDRNSKSETYKIDEYAIVPYFRGTFGPVDVESEFWYQFGELEGRGQLEDIDLKAWAWNIDLGFDIGPVGIGLGWAYTTGDDDPTDDDQENFTRAGGMDWQPLLIMTGYYMDANLGCIGNLNMRNAFAGNAMGYNLFYGNAEWSPWENFTLQFALGYAELNETDHIEAVWAAEEVGGSFDDEFGFEVDLGFTWQLMRNLTYNMMMGYFSEGDFFEKGDCDSDTDYEFSAIHALKVSF
jgi:hypothetical protein